MAPSRFAATWGSSVAICAEMAAKARPTANTKVNARVYVSIGEPKATNVLGWRLTNREAPDDQTKGASLAKPSNDQKVILSPLSGRSARRARLCAACVTFSAPVA